MPGFYALVLSTLFTVLAVNYPVTATWIAVPFIAIVAGLLVVQARRGRAR